MTIKEQEAIKLLQSQGYGYRKIAAETGISVNTVKSYCKRHPVGNEATADPECKCCIQCGAPLTIHFSTREKRFCSDKCRMAWWNARRSQVQRKTYHTKICPTCGQTFAAYGKKDQIFCSRTCFGISRRKVVDV